MMRNVAATPVRITISLELQINVNRKKKALSRRAFEITKAMTSSISMSLAGFVHELGQDMNRIGQVLTCDSEANEATICIWRSQERALFVPKV